MKIRVLGAAGSEGLAHRPSAFLVDDRLLIDGGTVGGALAGDEQLAIEHALVTSPAWPTSPRPGRWRRRRPR
jgi:hypothetical protein